MNFGARRMLVLGLALALGASACSSDDASSDASSADEATELSSEDLGSAGVIEDDSATTTTTPIDSDGSEASPAEIVVGDVGEVVAAFVGAEQGGAEVYAVIGGETYTAAAGFASSDGEALEVGRPFRAGSLAKSFVATMVMQMVEEGTVELDEVLGTYLSDVSVGSDRTIRELLSHKTGIANYTSQPAFFVDMTGDLSMTVSPEQVLSYVEGVEGGEVGTFAYSNTNYVLLGLLVEEIDDRELNASLSERITDRLDLETTYFVTESSPPPAGLVGAWSPGISDGDPATVLTSIETAAWAAGSLVSTAEELAVFVEAFASGQLVSATSVSEMTDFGNAPYAFGFAYTELNVGQTGFGHGGSIPGYSSFMMFDPSTGNLVVTLTNNDNLNAESLAVAVFAGS